MRNPARIPTAVACALLFVGAGVLPGCSRDAADPAPTRPAAEVLQEHSDSLFAIRGVRGTGVTDWREEEVIVVIVEDRDSTDMSRIPERLEGHRVLVLDEEEIRRWGGF